jgi:hypothetical protein
VPVLHARTVDIRRIEHNYVHAAIAIGQAAKVTNQVQAIVRFDIRTDDSDPSRLL